MTGLSATSEAMLEEMEDESEDPWDVEGQPCHGLLHSQA